MQRIVRTLHYRVILVTVQMTQGLVLELPQEAELHLVEILEAELPVAELPAVDRQLAEIPVAELPAVETQ
jgi:hypothetical protein